MGRIFITLVGGAYNTATARSEAMRWRSVAPCPADLNGDQVVDLADLSALLAHFGLPVAVRSSP